MTKLPTHIGTDILQVEAILTNIIGMTRDNKPPSERLAEIEKQAIRALKYLPEITDGQIKRTLALVNNVSIEEIEKSMPHLKD